MSTMMIAIGTLLATVTIWSAVCVINRMDAKTPFLRRLSFILLATGAAGMLIAPFYLKQPPTAGELLILLALAIMSFTDHHPRSGNRPLTNP